jgi:uncharacterized phage-associated protein
MMPTAEAVARYFLHLAAAAEEPTPMTQMQLYKLLYYAQGWCLAMRGRALFKGRFQAWAHGPVEVDVRPRFADYESRPIEPHEARDDPSIGHDDRSLIESIWMGYGKYSAWQLAEMTHREPPWKEARGSIPAGAKSQAPIGEEAMRAHFRSVHEASCRRMGLSAADLAESLAQARRGETGELELVARGRG